jgi:ribosomal-protein-serine acetyltransferase
VTIISVNNRLELSALEERDAEALFALAEGNRRDLRRWLLSWDEATRSLADCRAVIRHSLQRQAVAAAFVFGIRHRDSLIGFVGLTITAPGEGEIGYWLARAHWGRGIATESVREITSYGFRRQRVNHMVIRCDEGNARARAIPERLGFVLGGDDDGSHRSPGQRVYTLLFGDWEAGNSRQPA